jgi:hypothetical protein
MKVLIRLLLSVSLIILLASCARMVFIGKRIDPEIILEKEHHTIVFVNLFDYTTQVNVIKKEKNSYFAGVMSLLDGLSTFSKDSSFNFIVVDTLKKGVEEGLLTTLLQADTINAICDRFNASLLLALDSVSIFFEQDTVVKNYYGREYNAIKFSLNTRFFLSLYSSEGDLINRSEVDQESDINPRTSMSGLVIIVPTVARASDEIANLSFQAGQDYVAKFYPQIVEDTQQLFTGKIFNESNKFIFAKNWNKAIELLEPLTKNQDASIAAKAKHNLDVAKEASEAGGR